MQSEEEYKQEYLSGMHQSDYNDCRFAEDKVDYCKFWIHNYIPWANYTNPASYADFACAQKLKIASDKNYKTLCMQWADKISVYDKLDELGMSELKIPYYYTGRTKLTDEIYSALPDTSLIIKCNHGSGWNIVIDKSKFKDLPKYTAQKINAWLNLNYAYITGYEAQYEDIEPGIIIQPVLINMPTDYGFWCINGNIEGISLTRKLSKNLEEYIAFVDKYGKATDLFIGMLPCQDNLQSRQKEIVNKMIPYVETIAKQFDFVRVDMYYINGKIYFGETTFTPCSGRLEITSRSKLNET